MTPDTLTRPAMHAVDPPPSFVDRTVTSAHSLMARVPESAIALLGRFSVAAVIQILVYPAAYPSHGVWAAVLLWLMARRSGAVSLDHLLARQRTAPPAR